MLPAYEERTMSLANAENISKQLPSVLTLLDSAFSSKSAKKSPIQLTKDSHLSKEAFRKTFMFTSDLIFGRLGDNLSRKEKFHLGPELTPAVPTKAKPEKGLGHRVNKLADFATSPKPKKARLSEPDLSEMRRSPDEKIVQNIRRVPATGTHLYNDQQQTINKMLIKSDSSDEIDNRSDNAKNFTIERILGKEEENNLIENDNLNLMVHENGTTTFDEVKVKIERNSPEPTSYDIPDKNDQEEAEGDKSNKLPNISQFFEPVDSMEFQRSTVSKCDIGSKRGGTNFTWLNGDNTLCSLPIPLMIKDFPLLRNTGRIEFNRNTLGAVQAEDAQQQNVERKFSIKEEEETIEEVPEKPKVTPRPVKKKEQHSDGEETPTQPLQTRQQQQVSGSKGFKCEKCGKIYCRKYVLKIHMRTHSGEKPLKCQVCGKSFSDPSNMKKHVKLHETDHVTYPCKFCGRNFVRRRGLLNHLHSMHSRFPFVHPQI